MPTIATPHRSRRRRRPILGRDRRFRGRALSWALPAPRPSSARIFSALPREPGEPGAPPAREARPRAAGQYMEYDQGPRPTHHAACGLSVGGAGLGPAGADRAQARQAMSTLMTLVEPGM